MITQEYIISENLEIIESNITSTVQEITLDEQSFIVPIHRGMTHDYLGIKDPALQQGLIGVKTSHSPKTTASAPTKKKPVLSAPSQHIVHSKDDKNHKGKH